METAETPCCCAGRSVCRCNGCDGHEQIDDTPAPRVPQGTTGCPCNHVSPQAPSDSDAAGDIQPPLATSEHRFVEQRAAYPGFAIESATDRLQGLLPPARVLPLLL